MDQNRCGAEFLRSPLASRPEFALQAEPFFTKQARGHLTAVAIAVENDHTVAFVGNTMGEVLKVGGVIQLAPRGRSSAGMRVQVNWLCKIH